MNNNNFSINNFNKEEQEKERQEKERQQKLKQEVDELREKVEHKKAEMIGLIKLIRKLNPNFSDELTLQAISDVDHIKSKNLNELKDQLEKAYTSLNSAINNLNILNDELQNQAPKNIDEIKEIFDNKVKEFIQKINSFGLFAKHRRVYPSYNSIVEDFNKKVKELGHNGGNVDIMIKKIKLVNDTLESLDELMYKEGFTVVKEGELSGLRREAGIKADELIRLRDLAKKKYAALYYNTLGNISNDAMKSYNECDTTNAEDLKKVIVKLDNAISKFKWADNNEQDPVLKWQTQAHQNIDWLLNKATIEMQNNSNKTTIEDLKKEFNPLLCGRQALPNCWLYAICNAHNILKHLEKKDGIIQNTGERDDDDFDKVENFFKNHAKLSNEVISKAGNVDDQLEVLSKLGIKHTSVNLENESKDAESLKQNVNIVKTLMLKHFANSKAPVLINVKNMWEPFDSKNYADSNHAMVVVGLDIKNNEVAVANSNEEKIEVYNLNDLAYFICKHGATDFIRKNIEMIFTSLNNKEDFNYDNSNNTWDEFESKLLPAISK